MMQSNLDYINSLFTRKKGYIKIKSSNNLSRKNAIQILNFFTPQGSSPKSCIRISSINSSFGIGYYYMEDESTSFLSTYLLKNKNENRINYTIPMKEDDIPFYAKGIKNNYFSCNNDFNGNKIFDFFDFDNISALIYSLLSGDNMIIVHPNHKIRLQFLQSLINILPKSVLSYNRFTTNCTELDGNENIIGVNKLPSKYRSYKKLFLPLDTIFVDLENKKIEGEGVKRSNFTNNIVEILKEDYEIAINLLDDFLKQVINQTYKFNKSNEVSLLTLINHIESKIGIKPPIHEDWFAGF